MSEHDCEDALDRIFEFIDEELPREELARIGAHLKTCAPCEAEHKLNEKLKRRVADAGHESAPADLRARVLEAIRAAGCEMSDGAPA